MFEWYIMMRNEMGDVLKEMLRELAITTRDRLALTQREMGRRLEMSESSYSDIETGESMCGTLTTVLLLGMQSDPGEFIQHAERILRNLYNDESRPA